MSEAGDQFETGYALGDQLYAYWRSLPMQAARGLPYRDSLNPADIKSLLPNIYLLEWIDHDTLIMRLRGTWLDERVERPRDNYNLFEQYSEKHSEAYKDFIEALIRQPCAASLRRQRANEYGRAFCYHTSYFPLVPRDAHQAGSDNESAGDNDGHMFILGNGWLEPLDDEGPIRESPILYEGSKTMGLTLIDIGSGVPGGPFFADG